MNNYNGYITEFKEWETQTFKFEIPNRHVLGAATKGEDGEIFYFTIEEGEPDDKSSTREAYFYLMDYEGNQLKKNQFDTSR